MTLFAALTLRVAELDDAATLRDHFEHVGRGRSPHDQPGDWTGRAGEPCWTCVAVFFLSPKKCTVP